MATTTSLTSTASGSTSDWTITSTSCEFLVVVEHVGQPLRPKADPAGQRAVLGVRDEIDQRMAGPRRPGMRALRSAAVGAAIEDE